MVTPENPSGKSPNFQQALFEYFADIAFDSRMEYLLSNSDYKKTSFSTRTKSTLEIYPSVFGFNHHEPYLDDDGDTERYLSSTILDISGNITSFHDAHRSRITLVSHTDNSRRVTFDAYDRKEFAVTNTISRSKDFMTPQEAADVFFRAHSTKSEPYLTDIPDGKEGYAGVHEKIETLWEHSTKNNGERHIEYIIERESPSSTVGAPIYHRFFRHDTEYADQADTIVMTYQRVHKHPGLDTDTIYQLNITLANPDGSQVSTAHRITRTSSDFAITDLSAFCEPSKGIVNKLDVNNPLVLKGFVDSFDELLALI